MDEVADIGPEEFEVFATEEQKATVVKLQKYGWSVSHLWEYEQGSLCVWCIVRTPGQKGFTHCFVLPDGEMRRFENKIRIGGTRQNKDD